MAVAVTTEPTFRAGTPQLLFEGDYLDWFDVSPDGQYFVMMKESEEDIGPSQLNVVLNFSEELNRLVPTESD